MRGKVRRLSLGPKEQLQILKAAYEDWAHNQLLDRSKYIKLIDHRAHKFAADYIDNGSFKEDLVAYVAEQERALDAAAKARLARQGLIPLGHALLEL